MVKEAIGILVLYDAVVSFQCGITLAECSSGVHSESKAQRTSEPPSAVGENVRLTDAWPTSIVDSTRSRLGPRHR